MSVSSLIAGLRTSRDQIVRKCVDLGILNNMNHDLEDAVTVIEDLDTSLQTKSVSLGSSAPGIVTYDNGYSGLSKVNLSRNSYITGSRIASGHKILGVEGTASTVVNIKSLKATYTMNGSGFITMSINSSHMRGFPSGSFTPGSNIPAIKELIIYRVSRTNSINQPEASVMICPYDYSNYQLGYAITSNGQVLYGANAFSFNVVNNNTLKVELGTVNNGSRDVRFYFNGSYVIYILY